MGKINYRYEKELPREKVVELYAALNWSAAEKPDDLVAALANSDTLVSAWDGDSLVGLGNALSDGYLVVYYPHLLVLPHYQGKGIGKQIISILQKRYASFHQQVLVADGNSVEFYKKCGFSRAGACEPLWIYDGRDHD